MKNLLLLILLISTLLACQQSDEKVIDFGSSEKSHDYKTKYPILYELMSYQDQKEQWKKTPYKRLSLRRTGCFGSCPEYEVEFNKSGNATYTGKSYAPREGTYKSHIDIHSYTLLCAFLERINADEMTHYRALWTDDSSVIIEFENDAKNTTISDYGNQGPPELLAYRMLFDHIVDDLQWTKVTE